MSDLFSAITQSSLHCGDSREVLKNYPDDYFSAVITDPPYALVSIVKRFGGENAAPAKSNGASGVYARASAGFMGKQWDTGDVAFSEEFWQEVYRVLKPGGHVVSFGGTRTYHRMVCAIEDAGFEIRDQLQWLYGTGFPKSHDVSKAIDKAAPRQGLFDEFAKHFTERRKLSGLTQKDVAKHFPSKTGGITGCVWNWENGANVPTRDQWAILQSMIGLSDEWLPLIERVEAEREVIGQKTSGIANKVEKDHYTVGATKLIEVDITRPATPEAEQWEGWGTALKPANEPICLARKPLSEKTVALNVLKWGTGALNIDACRVEGESWGSRTNGDPTNAVYKLGIKAGTTQTASELGRFPANVITDGSVEMPNGAQRFFYSAKASKADRGEGNSHPTVKPTSLMQWLCRLVTPPGGVVLDPFMGSGSTGKAAHLEGFKFVGIEREEEYFEIAKRRVT